MKVLSIVETAYRATVEEQDDTILWLNHMLKNNGLDVGILLRGSAGNYAVKGQDASGLSFGDLEMSHPPQIDEDLRALMAKGAPVYYVREDVAERGIQEANLVEGVQPISRRDLPSLFEEYRLVWHW
ncbi:MAG: hypothetical protein E6J14_04350 [Chloroflexi bacterium]|nr:MAG: hypothetical protein E6J14_04350 [Chloroflexota bacterium]